MTNEEQNIAIAEVCGLDCIDGLWWNKDMPIRLPNYAGSFDAMHEAEKKLDAAQARIYSHEMKRVCVDAPANGPAADDYVWHATAAQRAEAFLRTLNLWTE